MKCIKAIKDGKYSKIDEIERLTDKEAYTKVDSGFWKFIPKSEWKGYSRKSKEEDNIEENEQNNHTKKQIKSKDGNQKTKKHQRSEKI